MNPVRKPPPGPACRPTDGLAARSIWDPAGLRGEKGIRSNILITGFP